MLSQAEGIIDFERKFSHVYAHLKNDGGFDNFIQWEIMLNPNNGFIKNDKISLVVDVYADKPTGV